MSTLLVHNFLTATETHMPYGGITQCYLLHGTDDIQCTRFYSSQLKLVLDLSTPGDARLSRPSRLGYVPRWYTRPKMVIRPTTNGAQCRVTSFMRRTKLPLRQTGVYQVRLISDAAAVASQLDRRKNILPV